MNPSVIVASPVSYKTVNGEPFFKGNDWLGSILRQDYPDFSVYILANDLTEQYRALLGDVSDDRVVIEDITLGNVPDERIARKSSDPNYERFAAIRNRVLDHVLSTGADYFCSIDSDIIVHPDCISRLVEIMESKKDYGIIACPVNNTRRSRNRRVYPAACYNFGIRIAKKRRETDKERFTYTRFKFKRGKFLDVDYTGACMIVRMAMLRAHPEVRWGPRVHGEDLYLCERVRETKYKIGVDTSIVTLHMMDKFTAPDDWTAFNTHQII